MPSIDTITTGLMREIQPVFWIIDTSASMSGDRMEIVERVFAKYEEMLKSISAIEIKTGVLSFNTSCRWVNETELLSKDNVNFGDFQLTTEGMTNVGVALHELNGKLSRKGFFKVKGSTVHRVPLIIFVLDGYSTDDYKSALEELKGNKWFQCSVKLGLAIGCEADIDLLKATVGEEGLFTEPNLLENVLSRLLVTNLQNPHMETDPISDVVQNNSAKTRAIIGNNILLPSFETESSEPEMLIDINHVEYEMQHGEYKIVRCQLGACDLRAADQVCFIANIQPDNKTIKLVNVDPVQDTLYMMRFNLDKEQLIELGVDLLDSMIISGNVQLSIKTSSICEIQGMSEHSEIAVFLDGGKQFIMKLGEKYEIETSTSKVNISFTDGWFGGDDWD